MASITTVVTQLLLEALIVLVWAVFKTMPSPSTLQAYLQAIEQTLTTDTIRFPATTK